MLSNLELKNELIVLVESQRHDVVRAWFSYWDNDEELIDKVLLWGHYFMPHYLRDASPDFHRDIIRKFFSKQNEYTAAPRGFSKTTIIQLCIAFSVANKMDKFIVLIEKTFTEASEVLDAVRNEFVDNERIQLAYGDLFKTGGNYTANAMIKNKDSEGDLFINGVRLRGKGFQTTIRGLKTRNWRPTRIVLDDVEEDEHIENPDQRTKYLNNYNKGIQPAVDVDGSIKVFGTILHQDSLLKNLIDTHGGKIYRAYDPADPANTLLWADRWSLERLEKKKQDMSTAGKSTNAFAQEYLNDPVSDEERVFKYNYLWTDIPDPHRPELTYKVPAKRITMEEFEKLRQHRTFNGYALIDVADSTKESADWTGLIVVFVDDKGNRYRVDARREKRNIIGLIDLIFEVWKMWRPYGLLLIGIEKKGFDDQVKPLFDEEKRKRQDYPTIEELKPMARNKQNRIKGALEGLYEQGKIFSVGRIDSSGYFRSVGQTNELLEELFNFPSAKNDDLSDAEAYQADVLVVPLEDEKNPTPHQNPVDDPFEIERQFMGASHSGQFDNLDPY